MKWVVFKRGDRILAAYTIKGTFPGELRATKELLAAENRCRPEDIKVELRCDLQRTTKERKNA